MARKRRRTSTRGVDKWKTKSWYQVVIPNYVDEDVPEDTVIAETLADDPDKLIGRNIQITMLDLKKNMFDLMHVKLVFKITKVDGDLARTEFHGHEMSRDYIRSQVRRSKTKIDTIYNVITKDGIKLRVSIMVITPHRCTNSHKLGIRRVVIDQIEERLTNLPFDQVVPLLISGEFADEVTEPARKVFPIQKIDVRKCKVLGRAKTAAV